MSAPPGGRPAPRAGAPGILGWCLYDWANSPFTTIVLTFVVPAYFARAVVGDEALAQADWGFMVGMAALAVAVLGPVLGAVADRTGRKKPWIASCAAVMVAASACLWLARPAESHAMLLLGAAAAGIVAFEAGIVFYNALLPRIAPAGWLGRVSGLAWGIGYAGGLSGLALVLFGFVQAEEPLLGLDRESLEHVRIAGPVVAAWMALFCLPLFLWTPDSPGTGVPVAAAAREGVRAVRRDLVGLFRDPARRTVRRYLIARMVFTDGINTLFAFGGIFAATTFGMSVAEVIQFGILVNVTAALGAMAGGWADDRLGAKATILIGLGALTLIGVPMLVVGDAFLFTVLGAALGLFFGPVQSASRSLMARLAPPGEEAETFGLYALSGKITAFAGPWLVGAVTLATGSSRWGLATVLPFLVLGGILLLGVPEPKRRAAPAGSG